MAHYPAPPQRRKAYDRDDTVVNHWFDPSGSPTAFSQTDRNNMNDEVDGAPTMGDPGGDVLGYIAFIFPSGQDFQLEDIYLLFQNNGNAGKGITAVDVEWSDDTTDGSDGSWTTLVAGITFFKSESSGVVIGVRPHYRENIQTADDGAARHAYRLKLTIDPAFVSGVLVRAIHLYGLEPIGPDRRIGFRLVGSDTEVAVDLDFEDMARAETPKKLTFRVKNLSSVDTANGIVLSVQDSPGGFAGMAGYTEISDDDVVYGSSVNIGNLGPGVLSGTIYLRCAPLSGDDLSVMAVRVTPSVTSWS